MSRKYRTAELVYHAGMTEPSIQDTPIFKKLLADAPAIEADLRTFNERYAQLVQRDDETVGTILRCHLVIEHFLDEYLEAANPGISNLNSARLTFAQKLALADNPRTVFALIMPGLRALNRGRNQLAHRLDATDVETTLQPIQEFVAMWRTAGGYEVPRELHAVQDFTLTACSFMHGATQAIQRHGQGGGLIGMLEWYAMSCNLVAILDVASQRRFVVRFAPFRFRRDARALSMIM
jgi:hypothetical protein